MILAPRHVTAPGSSGKDALLCRSKNGTKSAAPPPAGCELKLAGGVSLIWWRVWTSYSVELSVQNVAS